ncbi:MAG: CGLD27 family protein [Cyanobacteria bacterium J06592_8]
MRDLSISVCPVPPEQRPVNEYQELQESWFFSWVTLEWHQYLKKLAWVWAWSWLVCGPVAAASFPPKEVFGQFLVSGGVGASVFLAFVVTQLYLGWSYVRSRLTSSSICYEESGWYDGQTWKKTPEFLAQDRLILTYEVQPLLKRLRRTFYGLGLFVLVDGLIWLGLSI